MIEKCLYNILCDERALERENDRMKHLFKIFMKTSMAKTSQPKVEDEAHQIYSTVLSNSILKEQVRLHQRGITVHFRTWVGGDKDGHPFVNKTVMKTSLQQSRSYLLDFVKINLEESKKLISDSNMEASTKSLISKHQELIDSLKDLKTIKSEDGKKIKQLRIRLNGLKKAYIEVWGDLNFNLRNVDSIAWLYPALVLPLEFREDAEIVGGNSPESKKIHGMMETLRDISNGYEPKWYVRGFVLSMVCSEDDVLNGIALVKKYFKKQVIPVVPLFETKQALVDSTDILKNLFIKDPKLVELHKNVSNGRFEIMLGYSDSAKENGTLTSRYLISKTLIHLDRFFSKKALTPVFFHGSGGSVERGGGSIKEQINWWPEKCGEYFQVNCSRRDGWT